jgi:hypothetical protein
VTVDGILLRILLEGVSNPHAVFALTNPLSPFRIRTGVTLPLLVTLLVAIPFRGVAEVVVVCPTLSRRLPKPGVPVIPQFTTSAGVVTRAGVPDRFQGRSLRITGLMMGVV